MVETISSILAAAIFAVGAIFVLTLTLIRGKTKEIKWPPGPPKLPIIGNFHQLFQAGNLLHVTFAKMAEEYGPVMTVWMGGFNPTIVVSGHDHVWEVLVTKSSDFASRASYVAPTLEQLTASWRTVASASYNPHWHALRKGINNYVMNPLNISTQTSIQERDVEEMIHELGLEASRNGGVVKPLMLLKRTAMRLMGRLIFGSNFITEDDEFIAGLNSYIQDMHRASRNSGIANLFPITRFIPGLSTPFREWEKIVNKMEALFSRLLSISGQPDVTTYLDFLKTQNLGDEVVIANLSELFVLSIDSMTATTVWALAFLIQNQGIQQKLYEEVKGRVKVHDLDNMPYLHAVVKETMRMKPIAPLAIPHMATHDTMLKGVKIPKGTNVMVNLHQVLNDPKVWEDPQLFKPERFLDASDDGERVRAMEMSFLPFGAGRRVCGGMELAKLHIPLVLANLVSAYQWSCIDGKQPDMTEVFNGVLEFKTPLAAHIKHRHA